MENDNKSYAGIIGEPIADLAIKTNIGKLIYQVLPVGRIDFLPAVSKFDWDDYLDGYAGNHKRIDRVRIYFNGVEQPYYRVASIGGEYSGWQYGKVIDEKMFLSLRNKIEQRNNNEFNNNMILGYISSGLP